MSSVTGELRSCPKCGPYRVSWNGMSRHWLCLTVGCTYSAPPDPDQLTDYEKARKYDQLLKECDELRTKVAALEEEIEDRDSRALERDTLE